MMKKKVYSIHIHIYLFPGPPHESSQYMKLNKINKYIYIVHTVSHIK